MEYPKKGSITFTEFKVLIIKGFRYEISIPEASYIKKIKKNK